MISTKANLLYTIILGSILFFACKKDPGPGKKAGTKLECDTFSEHINTYQFNQRIRRVSIHKDNPNIIAYAIDGGIGIEVHSLDLTTHTDIKLAWVLNLYDIDFNKYGDLLIYGYTGDDEILLGRYDNPASFRNVIADSSMGNFYATWLADGEQFVYNQQYNSSIYFTDKNGQQIAEKQGTDSIRAVLGRLPSGRYVTLSKNIDGKTLVGTCDADFNNYKAVHTFNFTHLPRDLEYISGTNKLMYISHPETYLTEIDLESGAVTATPLHCENIIVEDIDYCPANGTYVVCLYQPVWENGRLISLRQNVCTGKLTDNYVEIIDIPR